MNASSSLLLSVVLASCLPVLAAEPHRSPVEVVVSGTGEWLATANQTSDSVSLLQLPDGKLLDELSVGEHPTGLIYAADSNRIYVAASRAGEVWELEVKQHRLSKRRVFAATGEPTGLAMHPDGKRLFVTLTALDQVAEIDLSSGDITRRIAVGRWPRSLAISPNGNRLVVSASGDRGVSVVDLAKGELAWTDKFMGINVGQFVIDATGSAAYFPWMVYRANPITRDNIQRGWVLASRIGKVRLEKQDRREAISLDPQGEAIADPYGIALTSDEQHLIVTAGGTHELLFYQLPGLPFESRGGPDHIDPLLELDESRFFRIQLGGRPQGLKLSPDNRFAYVANYLRDSVQVVDLEERKLIDEFPLGGPSEPSLSRRGEAIFYDGRRSLDQWYSCHSCHFEGGGNSVAIDTHNDGSTFSFKTVLPLHHVHQTKPWTWHGWQTDLEAAMRKSITSTMLGKEPEEADVKALIAHLATIEPPTNPYRAIDGKLTPSQERGQAIFQGRGGCASCHSGDHTTDGEVHVVGLEQQRDRYRGFNTPSLVGVYRKVKLLHDGRASSLESVLQRHHAPENVSGEALNEKELADLIEYLRTL